MAVRFRETGEDSFWGKYVFEQVVPETHFLRQLLNLIDWDRLAEDLVTYYKGGAEYGPAPYRPSTLLRMLLLSYLYNLSERETEAYVADSLTARYFIGIAANQPAPDHSTLSVFRDRMISKDGTHSYERVFQRIVRVAKEKGIEFGRIQVVDATHSIANVNVNEDNDRREHGEAARDDDASWGSKGRRKVKTTDGKTVLVNKTFYGYKAHVSLNAESRIITAVVSTTGKETDGHQFEKLVEKDEEAGVDAKIYSGDKAYDDGENHELLNSKGKKSALILNDYRTQKKDANKEPWIEMEASEEYQSGKKERYKVEQKFGEGKRHHGWGRCRYLGLQNYAVQSLLTALALNLKRMVLLLTGTSFRGPRPEVARA